MLCDIDKDKNTQALASIDEHFTVQTKHQKTSVEPSNHRVMGGVKEHCGVHS